MSDDPRDWFPDAKLGIFIHWTAAAIPAFAPTRAIDLGDPELDWEAMIREQPYAEQYLNTMLVPGSATQLRHAELYGDRPFADFVERFRDSLDAWEPEAWADLFARSGAKYVVLVTKHFDGFALWPTDVENPRAPRWHAERDVVGELAAAVRARGLRFGVYYCGGIDATFGGFPFFTKDEMIAATPQDADYAAYADGQLRELIDRYRPSVLWNDMDYPRLGDASGIVERFREVVPDGVVNDRFELWEPADLPADFATLEYRTDYTDAPGERPWESCRGIGASFGFNREEGEADYATTEALLDEFLEIVAHGGNLLLNVGPTALGAVPWGQATRLTGLGWWLAEHGEAVFGTRRHAVPRAIASDGRTVRFTATDTAVYAFVTGVDGAEVRVPFAGGDPRTVDVLGAYAVEAWRREGGELVIRLVEVPVEPVTVFRLARSNYLNTLQII